MFEASCECWMYLEKNEYKLVNTKFKMSSIFSETTLVNENYEKSKIKNFKSKFTNEKLVITKINVNDISVIDYNFYPIVVKHTFIDDFSPPTEYYGINKRISIEEITNLLYKYHLYNCAENDIYLYNIEKNCYENIKHFRNTDNGRY